MIFYFNLSNRNIGSTNKSIRKLLFSKFPPAWFPQTSFASINRKLDKYGKISAFNTQHNDFIERRYKMNVPVKRKRAVMMEYVIIAVLIAAAVVAVIMLGKNVSSEMNVATRSMSDAKAAVSAQKDIKTQAEKDVKSAEEHRKGMHNYDQ